MKNSTTVKGGPISQLMGGYSRKHRTIAIFFVTSRKHPEVQYYEWLLMIIIYWFLYYYGLLCVAIIIIIIA